MLCAPLWLCSDPLPLLHLFPPPHPSRFPLCSYMKVPRAIEDFFNGEQCNNITTQVRSTVFNL